MDLEALAEDIVKQKGRALQRRQPFQRQHQRQGDILHRLILHQRIGQPRAGVGLAPHPRGFQMIEAQPRDDPPQKGAGHRHAVAVRSGPAQEGLLHHILGIAERAEHAVGGAHQHGPMRIECGVDQCHPSSGA
jgi:hypothetical protein